MWVLSFIILFIHLKISIKHHLQMDENYQDCSQDRGFWETDHFISGSSTG